MSKQVHADQDLRIRDVHSLSRVLHFGFRGLGYTFHQANHLRQGAPWHTHEINVTCAHGGNHLVLYGIVEDYQHSRSRVIIMGDPIEYPYIWL